MGESLLDRMLPYISATTARIAGGLLEGLWGATWDARRHDAISGEERTALLQRVNYYYPQQNDRWFVCVHLTPDMYRPHPSTDTRVLAAERWREWAINLVRDVQLELHGY